MTAVKDKLIYRFPKSIITQHVDKNEKKSHTIDFESQDYFKQNPPKEKKTFTFVYRKSIF